MRTVNNSHNSLYHGILSLVIEKLDSFIIIADEETNIVIWNKAAENCFCIPEEFAVGKKVFDLPVIWDRDQIREQLEQSGSINAARLLNLELERPDNQKRWISFRIYKINSSEDNNSSYIFLVGNDVTEQTKSFELLKEDNKFKAIGELSAGIAHEINSPLQYIHNNLTFISSVLESHMNIEDKLLSIPKSQDSSSLEKFVKNLKEEIELQQTDEISSEAREAIDQSMEGVRRIEVIVNSLKNYAHPEKDEPVDVNLISVVQDSINLSINEWKYVADIETDFPSYPVIIKGYPTYLSQVIVNILVNAGHAIEELRVIKDIKGLIKLKVSTGDGMAGIRIEDNGIGMREEVRSRIFEPFFTTKRIGKGTGQGLAIAYSIIANKHMGQITCESTVGEGSAFYIELPVDMNDGK